MVLLLRLECELKGTIFYSFKLDHFVVIWNVGNNVIGMQIHIYEAFLWCGNSKHIFCSSHTASCQSALDFCILQTMFVRIKQRKNKVAFLLE